jgi:1,2-diacylglycerol 3-alpha-glucosyltransferase
MIRELKKYGVTRDVEVIRNGGDHVADRLDKKTGDKFTMLYVGLVVKFKNIEFILRSLRKLKAIRSDFVFYIVGDGPDKKRYERLVKRYDLSENVIFTGRVLDRDRLNELYAKSDLFLFASRIDTDGLTVLEAGTKGTPSLVLSDMATAERIRDGETGFIVKGEESVHARKISELMDSRDLVLEVGKKAHEIFEGWDKIAEQYLDCYQRVIKK